MTLTELQSRLNCLEIHIAMHGDKLVVDAPTGLLTPEIKSALRVHKPGLMKWLSSQEASETPRPPVPREHLWQTCIAYWPFELQTRWAARAAALSDSGAGTVESQWWAFLQGVAEINAAEARGEVIAFVVPPKRPASQSVALGPDRDRLRTASQAESDPYAKEERAAIMEYDGGLTREAAERAAGLRS
jgi:hypothetical protein